jgi:hypothetical protein
VAPSDRESSVRFDLELQSMTTIREMRQVSQQRRPNAKGKMVWAGHWFNRLFVRHFSIYITWLFVKMGISANTVTFLIIPTSLIGVALCVPHVLWMNVVGFLLLMTAEVFDCVDGEIARWTNKSSLKGLYLDLVSHILCNAPMSIICALHAYMLYGNTKYLILGFLAYAAAQCRVGLDHAYAYVSTQIYPDQGREPKDSEPSDTAGRKQVGSVQMAFDVTKWLLIKSTDTIVIRVVSFVGICLTYAGMVEPLIFLAWFFAISGVFGVAGETASKCFVHVPHKAHVKKV